MIKRLLTLALILTTVPAYADLYSCADHQPASNTAAVATLSNGKNYTIFPTVLHWSYDTAPTGGKVTLKSASTTISEVDVTAAGPGFLPLDGFASVRNEALSATLAAGGASVTGKVSMCGRYK